MDGYRTNPRSSSRHAHLEAASHDHSYFDMGMEDSTFHRSRHSNSYGSSDTEGYSLMWHLERAVRGEPIDEKYQIHAMRWQQLGFLGEPEKITNGHVKLRYSATERGRKFWDRNNRTNS